MGRDSIKKFKCEGCGKSISLEESHMFYDGIAIDIEYGNYNINKRYCDKCNNERLGLK